MRRLACGLLVALSGCVAMSKVQMEHVARLEIDMEPVQIVEGKNLKKVLAGATCHDDTKKWVRGKDATIVLDDSERLKITGISDTGHFIRLSNIQWCELSDAAWAALWK